MKATRLIAAVVLATCSLGAFAAQAAGSEDGYMSSAAQQEWFQAGTFALQGEAQAAELEREGFPQYID